jgi:hypothetical protein
MGTKLRRFLSIVLILLCLPALAGADAPKESPFLGEIDLDTPLPDTGSYVYILSPGGSIDRAFELAEQVKGKTCIIFGAASAALMIVMPACKERYFVYNAIIQFHSAGVVLPPMYFLKEWDAAYLASELAKANLRIMRHMVLNGVPWSPEFLEVAMRLDLDFAGEELGQWGEWLRPVQECTHCPYWTKLVGLSLPASQEQ